MFVVIGFFDSTVIDPRWRENLNLLQNWSWQLFYGVIAIYKLRGIDILVILQ